MERPALTSLADSYGSSIFDPSRSSVYAMAFDSTFDAIYTLTSSGLGTLFGPTFIQALICSAELNIGSFKITI